MPIHYAFDPDFGFVHTRCVGATTLDEVRDHFRALANEPMPPRLDVLLDLTETTSLPSTDQLRSVIGEIVRLGVQVKWGSFAVAAASDVWFGLSRMLAVFAEPHFARTWVFRDISTAKNWIVQGDEPAEP